MASNVSIYLIKDNYNDDQIILNYDEFINEREGYTIKKFDDHTAYIWSCESKAVSLFKDFYGNDLGITDDHTNIRYSIVDIYNLLIDGKEIKLAVCFGYPSKLHKIAVVNRFGLKTLLNSSPDNEFREMKLTDVTKECKSIEQKTTRNTSISEFDISYNTNIIKGVSGKITLFNLKVMIKGTDSIYMSIKDNHVSIKNLLIELYKNYNLMKYKEQFEWIDYIEEIKDKSIIEELNSMLIKSINAHSNNTWLALPDDIDLFKVDKVAYIKKKNSCSDSDISLGKYLKTKASNITFNDIKKDEILILDNDDNIIDKYKINDLLYSEMDYLDSTYIRENKLWYKTDENFKSEVENFYRNVLVSKINLPSNIFRSEAEYNNSFDNDENYYVLDRKIIQIDMKDKFELCDLLSINNELIHIKKYGNSSHLSHLFMQGLRSARAISDKRHVNLINEKINKEEFKISNTNEYTVVFAIISKVNNERPNIPFFAKSSFKLVADELTRYNFSFQIKSILEMYKTNN